jgi:MarR family transcriptional regulator, organic hydroperoxide resistance regulator
MKKKPNKQVGTLPASVSRPELLVSGTDREFRELVHHMLTFATTIQDVRNRLGEAIGLSGTQYTTLMAIARLAEHIPNFGINELAEQLHWSGAFVTIEVNKLVQSGLVFKKPNPKDRRRVLLSITELATQKIIELAPIQAPTNDALFDGLSTAEFLFLKTIMARLAASSDKALALVEYMSKSHVNKAC